MLDYDDFFVLVVGKLKLPKSAMNDLSIHELRLLLDYHEKEKQEFFIGIQRAVAFGYASAKKGKWIDMYKKESQSRKTTEQERAETKEYIESVFGVKL